MVSSSANSVSKQENDLQTLYSVHCTYATQLSKCHPPPLRLRGIKSSKFRIRVFQKNMYFLWIKIKKNKNKMEKNKLSE